MGAKKHSEIETAAALTSADLIHGIRNNGDGTYTNYNFGADQIADYIGGGPGTEQTHTAGSTVTISAGKNYGKIMD